MFPCELLNSGLYLYFVCICICMYVYVVFIFLMKSDALVMELLEGHLQKFNYSKISRVNKVMQ